jgi:serralysin
VYGGDNDDHLRGDEGADVLYGDSGADTINGGSDRDRMVGGTGGDRYFVDNAGDKVIESAGAGVDTVFSSVSFSLGALVDGSGQFAERLTLTGPGQIDGTGNGSANLINGNGAVNILGGGGGGDRSNGGSGNDTLRGGSGNDTLAGGSGRDTLSGGNDDDTFRFAIGESGVTTATVDTITGWLSGDDFIDFATKGSERNYLEARTTATNIQSASTVC